MPTRKCKDTGKYRGTRTQGGGDPKNRRGKGTKGGWGRAGMKKHRFTYATRYEPGKFGSGSRGFKRYNVNTVANINVRSLEVMAVDGKVLFKGKVLGAGDVTKKVEVWAYAFSKTAKDKIEKAGGKAILLEALPSSKAQSQSETSSLRSLTPPIKKSNRKNKLKKKKEKEEKEKTKEKENKEKPKDEKTKDKKPKEKEKVIKEKIINQQDKK